MMALLHLQSHQGAWEGAKLKQLHIPGVLLLVSMKGTQIQPCLGGRPGTGILPKLEMRLVVAETVPTQTLCSSRGAMRQPAIRGLMIMPHILAASRALQCPLVSMAHLIVVAPLVECLTRRGDLFEDREAPTGEKVNSLARVGMTHSKESKKAVGLPFKGGTLSRLCSSLSFI